MASLCGSTGAGVRVCEAWRECSEVHDTWRVFVCRTWRCSVLSHIGRRVRAVDRTRVGHGTRRGSSDGRELCVGAGRCTVSYLILLPREVYVGVQSVTGVKNARVLGPG